MGPVDCRARSRSGVETSSNTRTTKRRKPTNTKRLKMKKKMKTMTRRRRKKKSRIEYRKTDRQTDGRTRPLKTSSAASYDVHTMVDSVTVNVTKKQAKLFLSELRHISTNFDNFRHKYGQDDEILWGALIFHLIKFVLTNLTKFWQNNYETFINHYLSPQWHLFYFRMHIKLATDLKSYAGQHFEDILQCTEHFRVILQFSEASYEWNCHDNFVTRLAWRP